MSHPIQQSLNHTSGFSYTHKHKNLHDSHPKVVFQKGSSRGDGVAVMCAHQITWPCYGEAKFHEWAESGMKAELNCSSNVWIVAARDSYGTLLDLFTILALIRTLPYFN